MCARINTSGITCERAVGKLGMLRICEHMPDSRNTNIHALFRVHNLKILGGPSLANLIDRNIFLFDGRIWMIRPEGNHNTRLSTHRSGLQPGCRAKAEWG